MTQTVPATAVLGPGKTGLTIGVTVLNLDGTTYAAFSATGVAETSVAGTYRKAGGVMCPDAGAYLVWGVSGTAYAEATVGGAGTPPTVEEIRAEMDSNSTQLAAIVADTNELQTNQGNWLTATGFATPTNITAASGISLAATQGAVAFGQVRITADVAYEGALHIVNTNNSGWGFAALAEDANGIGFLVIGGDTNTSPEWLSKSDITKYLALLIRKDAWVAADLAAYLADLNINYGSGGGAYDNTTDSLEALRDRGDAAWATATGFATAANLATLAGYVDTEVAAILAAVDTEVAAIKTKTDNLPASPAAVGSEMVLTVAYDAAKTAATQTSVNDLPTNAELATALAGADDTVLAAVAALNNLSSAQAQTAAAAALTAYDPPTNAEMEARTLAAASYATASALDAVDNYVDTEVAAIKAVTDKLDTALEDDGSSGYQFTTLALENAPTGGAGTAPTVEEIRAEMDANSTKLANLDATVSSRATPTNITAGTITTVTTLTNAPAGMALESTSQSIKVKTDLLSAGGEVVLTSPVADGGDVRVFQGDDYANVDGRSLEWSGTTWADLTAAQSVTLYVRAPNGATFSTEGSVVSAGGATQTVRIELTAAETALLVGWLAASTLRVRAVLASGGKATLVDTTLTAIEDIA